MPQPIKFKTQDGFELNGFEWRAPQTDSSAEIKKRHVVIINAATSVQCRYYFRFAQYLYDHGFDVITYDYRGIGVSKAKNLKGFNAGWLTWGEQDLEAVLKDSATRYLKQNIFVVGHSIGGVLVGLAPSNYLISRVFSMGSQQAYWPDYLASQKISMLLKWHGLMPMIALAMGYVPAKRLGWMEDTPKHVAMNWATMGKQFIPSLVKSPLQRQHIQARFEQLKAPILAFGTEDDPFGTSVALDRILQLFSKSERYHLRIDPKKINLPPIGHFAFFNDRFKETLWPIALAWLQTGVVTQQPGFSIQTIPPREAPMR